MSDCEFSCDNGHCVCVVCGQEIATDYPPEMLHCNCPVELIEDINAGGVGTELHKLLLRLGADVTLDCKCAKRIAVMNTRGSKWCRQNVALIVTWLRAAARQQELFSYSVLPRRVWNIGAARLVLSAIRRAEKNRV